MNDNAVLTSLLTTASFYVCIYQLLFCKIFLKIISKITIIVFVKAKKQNKSFVGLGHINLNDAAKITLNYCTHTLLINNAINIHTIYLL